jgi:hypothetical protein
MDAWLKRHLVDNGHLTESGASRKAKPRRCRTCNAVVVIGLDADMCAFEVHADPVPLSQLGEALAVATGRRTVSFCQSAGAYLLEQRWVEDIKARPAGTGTREDVLAEHRCREPVPDLWSAPTSFKHLAAASSQPSAPPF